NPAVVVTANPDDRTIPQEIFAEVDRIGQFMREGPADMCMPKTSPAPEFVLVQIMRRMWITNRITKLMVPPVVAHPVNRRALRCHTTKDDEDGGDRLACLKRAMC